MGLIHIILHTYIIMCSISYYTHSYSAHKHTLYDSAYMSFLAYEKCLSYVVMIGTRCLKQYLKLQTEL